jgi:hypothetical protein
METKTRNVPAQNNALTPEEEAVLTDCESLIRRGAATFSAVGEALIRIRDLRLFRATAPSFEEYCRQSLRMSKQYTCSVIACTEVVGALGKNPGFGGRLPENEAQARPLKGLEAEERVQAWEEVLARCGSLPVTARLVREVVRTTHPGHVPALDASLARPVMRIRRNVKSLRRAMENVANPKAGEALRLVSELEALLDDL